MTTKIKLYDAPKNSSNFPPSSKVVERDGKKYVETGLADARPIDVVWQDGEFLIAKSAGRMAQGAERGGSLKYSPTEYFLVNSGTWHELGRVEPGRGRACQTAIKEFQAHVATLRSPAAV